MTYTGDVDEPVGGLLVQSLEARVQPGRLLGKLVIRLIVGLIEPAPRKLFAQTQAEQLFSSEVKEIQSSDIVGQHDTTFNQAIETDGYRNIHIKKKGRNIPFHCKCAFTRAADW
jgi:hypothetical protein